MGNTYFNANSFFYWVQKLSLKWTCFWHNGMALDSESPGLSSIPTSPIVQGNALPSMNFFVETEAPCDTWFIDNGLIADNREILRKANCSTFNFPVFHILALCPLRNDSGNNSSVFHLRLSSHNNIMDRLRKGFRSVLISRGLSTNFLKTDETVISWLSDFCQRDEECIDIFYKCC